MGRNSLMQDAMYTLLQLQRPTRFAIISTYLLGKAGTQTFVSAPDSHAGAFSFNRATKRYGCSQRRRPLYPHRQLTKGQATDSKFSPGARTSALWAPPSTTKTPAAHSEKCCGLAPGDIWDFLGFGIGHRIVN